MEYMEHEEMVNIIESIERINAQFRKIAKEQNWTDALTFYRVYNTTHSLYEAALEAGWFHIFTLS